MPPPAMVVVVVLVASGDGGDAAMAAMARATQDALGADARVIVREAPGAPPDDSAIQAERSEGAAVAAEVSWDDPQRQSAMLRVHSTATGAWIERHIGFNAADAPAERGRTLGFALASMVSGEPPPTVPPPVPPRPVEAIVTVAQPAEQPPRALAPPTSGHGTGAVDLAVVGTSAFGGYADAGAALGAEWSPAPTLSARLALGARGGSVSAADATSLVLFAAPGLAWRPVTATAGRPFGLGARASYVLLRHSLGRTGSPTPPALFVSGASLLVEGAWMFGGDAGAFVAAGAEVALGTLDVRLDGRPAGAIPAWRVAGEGGLRVRF